jgi:hypothetical protein
MAMCLDVFCAEYMGFLVRNGTAEDLPLLGLQSGSRVPQISDIAVDKDGMALKVRPGRAVTARVRSALQASSALQGMQRG